MLLSVIRWGEAQVVRSMAEQGVFFNEICQIIVMLSFRISHWVYPIQFNVILHKTC